MQLQSIHFRFVFLQTKKYYDVSAQMKNDLPMNECIICLVRISCVLLKGRKKHGNVSSDIIIA